MLIIGRLNCIDAASSSQSVAVRGTGWGEGRERRPLTERTIADAASVHFSLLMMSI
jgi:hypothetical protein